MKANMTGVRGRRVEGKTRILNVRNSRNLRNYK
jgi:hypothetical protein